MSRSESFRTARPGRLVVAVELSLAIDCRKGIVLSEAPRTRRLILLDHASHEVFGNVCATGKACAIGRINICAELPKGRSLESAAVAADTLSPNTLAANSLSTDTRAHSSGLPCSDLPRPGLAGRGPLRMNRVTAENEQAAKEESRRPAGTSECS